MKEYVLALVFDESHKNLILMKRKKDPYNGLLNGIGGKVDPGETHFEAMKREFTEEVGFENPYLEHLVTLSFPFEHLHVYYARVKHQPILIKENHEGIYDWHEIEDSFFDMNNTELAGEGNLPYFIKYALELKKGE